MLKRRKAFIEGLQKAATAEFLLKKMDELFLLVLHPQKENNTLADAKKAPVLGKMKKELN
ncbi:MAG: hypothetical protein ACXAB4_11505 [Candidatus Hodarchaeales archaeon]